MGEKLTRKKRLGLLDSEIREGKYPSCLGFSRRHGIARKTVQRDINHLRKGGRIQYDRKEKGYYYTDQKRLIPSLGLTEADLLAVLVGANALEAYSGTHMTKRYRRVIEKLRDMVVEDLSFDFEDVFSHFSFTGPPAKPVNAEIWSTVVSGLMGRRSVQISYQKIDDDADQRVIDPYHMANFSGEWYIFAHCHKRKRVLQFAIPRIVEAELLKDEFIPPVEFEPEPYISTMFGRFGSRKEILEFKLVFRENIAPWILERQWHPQQRVRMRKNGDVELMFETAGIDEVFHWVMGWGRWCRVIKPKELKERVKNEVEKMWEMVGGKEKE